MADFEQAPSAEELEKAEFGPPVYNPEKALENKEFVKFLENYEEGAEPAEVWEIFEDKNYLKKELPQLFKKKLEPAFGLEINKSEIESLSDYLHDAALNAPQELKDRANELRAYLELESEKVELEKRITELGGEPLREAFLEQKRAEREAQRTGLEEKKGAKAAKRAALEETLAGKREAVKRITGWRRWVNPQNWELLEGVIPFKGQAARKEMRELSEYQRNEYFTKLEAQIADLKEGEAGLERQLAALGEGEAEKFLKNYPTIKERTEAIMKNLQKKFFLDFAPAKEIFMEVDTKIMQKLMGFASKVDRESGLKFFDEAQQYLELVESGKKSFPSEELRHLELEPFQKLVDNNIERAVHANIGKIISEFKIENKPLSEMRAQLKDYLTREKLGSKDKEKTKYFIDRTILEYIAKLSEEKPAGYKTKVRLLRFIAGDVAYTQ